MSKRKMPEKGMHYPLSDNITSNYPHKHIRQFSDRNIYTTQRTKASVMGFHDMECSHCDAIMYPVIGDYQVKNLVIESKSFHTVTSPKSSKAVNRSKVSKRQNAELKRQEKRAQNQLMWQRLCAERRKKEAEVEKAKKRAKPKDPFRNIKGKRVGDKQFFVSNATLVNKLSLQHEHDIKQELYDAVNQPSVVQMPTGKQIQMNLSNKPGSSKIPIETQPSSSHDDVILHPESETIKTNTSNETKKLPAIGSKAYKPCKSKVPTLVGRVTPRVISVEKQVSKSNDVSEANTTTLDADHISVESNQATSSAAFLVQNISQKLLQQSDNSTKCAKNRKSCMICQKYDCVCEKKQEIRLNAKDMFVDFSKDPESNPVDEPEDHTVKSYTLSNKSTVQEFSREVTIIPPTCTRAVTIIPTKVTEYAKVTNTNIVNKKRKKVRIRKIKKPLKESILHTEQNIPGYTRKVEILPSTNELDHVSTQNIRCHQGSAIVENVASPNRKTVIIREVTILPVQNKDTNINNFQKKSIQKEKERICAYDFVRDRIAVRNYRRSGIPSTFKNKMIGEWSLADCKVKRHDDRQCVCNGSDENDKVGISEEESYFNNVYNEKESSTGLLEESLLKCLTEISDDESHFMAESRTEAHVIDLSDISDEEIPEAYKHKDVNLSDISDCEMVMNDEGITGHVKQSLPSKEESKDKVTTDDASLWAWRKIKMEGRLVTCSAEMRHVTAFLRILDKRYWIKVIVTGYPMNWTREQVLDILVNWRDLANLLLLPCFVDFTPEKCLFLVHNCTEALKFLVDRGLVVYGDGFRMNLGLRDVVFQSGFRFNDESRLKRIINNTYDEVTRSVNMKEFLLGSDKNSLIYCPLSKVHNQRYIVRLDTKVKWHQVTRLNLSGNRLTTLEGFDIVKNLPSLIELDVSDNLLASVKQLIACYGCTATSVRLEGNPLCLDFVHQDEYTDAMKLLFPKLVCLDGVKISGLPDAQRNFCPHPEAMPYVEQFLNIYFSMAEAKIPSLSQMYSVGAVLTLSCEARLKKLPQYETLPMVRACRDVRLLNELFEECFMGNTAIADELESYPPIIYDTSTFTIDVLDFTAKYAIVNITGTFRVLDRVKPEDCALLDFTRMFVLSSRNGVEFVINNDMFYLAEPTLQRREAAFASLVPQPPLSIEMESPPSEELKTDLVDIFSKITKRPHSEGLRCLEMRNWNIRSALQYFVQQTREEINTISKQVEEEKNKLIEAASGILKVPRQEIDPNASCTKPEETVHDSFNSERSGMHESFESTYSVDSKAEQMYTNFANNGPSPVKVYGHTENMVLPNHSSYTDHMTHADARVQPVLIGHPDLRPQLEFISHPDTRAQPDFTMHPDHRAQPEFIGHPGQRVQPQYIGHPVQPEFIGCPNPVQPIHGQMYGNFGPPIEEPRGPMHIHQNCMVSQQPMYGDFNNQYGNFGPRTNVGQPCQEMYGVPNWGQQ